MELEGWGFCSVGDFRGSQAFVGVQAAREAGEALGSCFHPQKPGRSRGLEWVG